MECRAFMMSTLLPVLNYIPPVTIQVDAAATVINIDDEVLDVKYPKWLSMMRASSSTL